MPSSFSFYKSDYKNTIPHILLKIMAYFKLVAPTCHVQGILINEDPYGFCYGRSTTEFVNTAAVKVNTCHGNTFPKVFPL